MRNRVTPAYPSRGRAWRFQYVAELQPDLREQFHSDSHSTPDRLNRNARCKYQRPDRCSRFQFTETFWISHHDLDVTDSETRIRELERSNAELRAALMLAGKEIRKLNFRKHEIASG